MHPKAKHLQKYFIETRYNNIREELLQEIGVIPRGDTASTTVSPMIPSTVALILAGFMEENLAAVGGMSGSPSLAEGSVNHPLELEAVGLSFEALTPKD